MLAYNLASWPGLRLPDGRSVLVRRWTGSWSAGLISGCLAAFDAHVLVRLAHLQTQHVEFLALVLFAFDRLVSWRRTRDAVMLGVGFALQGLTSVYVLVFSTWMLVFAVPARAREWLRRNPAEMIGLLVLSGATAAILMAPYLLAYDELHRLTGLERTLRDGRWYAGSWVDYLSTGSRIHYAWWSSRYFAEAMSSTFPGLVATALAALAITRKETRRDARVRMCLVVAIGCATVSVLPRTPVYPLLYGTVPLFRAVRVQAHIGQIVLLMIAILAGFGVAGLGRRWRDARTWPVAGAALCVLVNLEALRAPLEYQPFSEIPPIYDRLAAERGAVVVELPLYEPRYSFGNAPYMLNSTRHWRPILNGYSGFLPGWYAGAHNAVQGFPDVASLIDLHERGVTHVVVHAELFDRDRLEAIARTPSLQPVAASGDIHLYRLR